MRPPGETAFQSTSAFHRSLGHRREEASPFIGSLGGKAESFGQPRGEQKRG